MSTIDDESAGTSQGREPNAGCDGKSELSAIQRLQQRIRAVDAAYRRELAARDAEIADLRSQLAVANMGAAELEGTVVALASFSDKVAHHLKTPLAEMAGISSLLVLKYGEWLPESGKKKLDQLVKSAFEMAETIDGLRSPPMLRGGDADSSRVETHQAAVKQASGASSDGRWKPRAKPRP